MQWVRSVSSECLAMIHWWVRMLSMSVWLRFGERGRWLRSCFCSGRLFLWWLGVILMDGCGYVFLFYFILFYFIFSCSGLWLPWWCLWLVVVVGCGCYNGSYGRWSRDSGGGGGGCYRFLCVFLIILISRQYNFKCSKNYRSFDVGCILKWGGIIDKVGF